MSVSFVAPLTVLSWAFERCSAPAFNWCVGFSRGSFCSSYCYITYVSAQSVDTQFCTLWLNIMYVMYLSLFICCILILEHKMFSSVVQVHLDLTAVSAQRADVTFWSSFKWLHTPAFRLVISDLQCECCTLSFSLSRSVSVSVDESPWVMHFTELSECQ